MMNITREDLFDLYINKKMGTDEISRLLKCSRSAVFDKLKKYGITYEMKKLSYVLSTSQRDFMIGSLLGDGCLTKTRNGVNYLMQFLHSDSQVEYLKFKYKIMNNLCTKTGIKKKLDRKRNYYMYSFNTKSLPVFSSFREYDDTDLLDELNENSLLIWLMDDGSITNGNSYRITCNRFNKDTMHLAVDIFKKKFNVDAYVHYRNKETMKFEGLRFRIEGSNKISNIIRQSDFYEEIKNVMNYKLIY